MNRPESPATAWTCKGCWPGKPPLVSQQHPGTLTVYELQAGGPALILGAVNCLPMESHSLPFTGSFHLTLNIHPISHAPCPLKSEVLPWWRVCFHSLLGPPPVRAPAQPQFVGASTSMGSPGGSVVRNSSANAGDEGDMGLISESRRFPGVGNDNPLQYS